MREYSINIYLSVPNPAITIRRVVYDNDNIIILIPMIYLLQYFLYTINTGVTVLYDNVMFGVMLVLAEGLFIFTRTHACF
jgi:hypothetical protein